MGSCGLREQYSHSERGREDKQEHRRVILRLKLGDRLVLRLRCGLLRQELGLVELFLAARVFFFSGPNV